MTPLLTGVFASQISGRLTVPDSGAMFPIAMVNVGTATSTITFSNIPNTYKHLQIRGITRFAGNDSGFGMWFNNDTTSSNYYSHNLGTAGAGTTYAQAVADSFISWSMPNNSTTANVFLGMVVDILDYSSTSKFKTARNLHGFDANGSGRMLFSSELWRNTNAVNEIKFDSRIQGSTSDFAPGTQFALYGIKG